MQYWVIMLDHGKNGREALVNPEDTRRGAIQSVRDALSDKTPILFIHEVNDFGDGHMMVSDVKDELIEAAGLPEVEAIPFDHQAAAWDRARDYAKQG